MEQIEKAYMVITLQCTQLSDCLVRVAATAFPPDALNIDNMNVKPGGMHECEARGYA